MTCLTYPLWAFTDGRRIEVIRGHSQKSAMRQVTRTWPTVGQEIRPVEVCELNWAEEYGKRHRPDWLNRAPDYEWYAALVEPDFSSETMW